MRWKARAVQRSTGKEKILVIEDANKADALRRADRAGFRVSSIEPIPEPPKLPAGVHLLSQVDVTYSNLTPSPPVRQPRPNTETDTTGEIGSYEQTSKLVLLPSPLFVHLAATLRSAAYIDFRDFPAGIQAILSRATYAEMVAGSGIAWDHFEVGRSYEPVAAVRVSSLAPVAPEIQVGFGEAAKVRNLNGPIDAVIALRFGDSIAWRFVWGAQAHCMAREMSKGTPDERAQAHLDSFHEIVLRTTSNDVPAYAPGWLHDARCAGPYPALWFLFWTHVSIVANMMCMTEARPPAESSKILAFLGLSAISFASAQWASVSVPSSHTCASKRGNLGHTAQEVTDRARRLIRATVCERVSGTLIGAAEAVISKPSPTLLDDLVCMARQIEQGIVTHTDATASDTVLEAADDLLVAMARHADALSSLFTDHPAPLPLD